MHDWGVKQSHLEVPDTTNTQRFHEQRNLVNSCSNGGNISGSVNPYVSDYPLAQHRTKAVEPLFTSSFTKRSCRKQKVNELYDRGDRGG